MPANDFVIVAHAHHGTAASAVLLCKALARGLALPTTAETPDEQFVVLFKILALEPRTCYKASWGPRGDTQSRPERPGFPVNNHLEYIRFVASEN